MGLLIRTPLLGLIVIFSLMTRQLLLDSKQRLLQRLLGLLFARQPRPLGSQPGLILINPLTVLRHRINSLLRLFNRLFGDH